MIGIVKDINVLKQISKPVETVKEALEIIEKLKGTLDGEKMGVGLAAIQIGTPKTIAVLKKEFFANNEYFYLINPKIIEGDNKFLFFNEGCLSFPNQFFNTYRYEQILFENLRIEGDKFEVEKRFAYYPIVKEDSRFCADNPITAIAIQHEFDHFEGKIITEFSVKNEPIVKEKGKVGRNEPCPCGSNKKFKKCCINKE